MTFVVQAAACCGLWIAGGVALTTSAQETPPPVTNVDASENPAPPDEDSGVCKSADDPPGALRVHSVIVEGRWKGKLDLPLKAGDLLTEPKASASERMLLQAISESSASYFNSAGALHVIKVAVDCHRLPDGTVDFILTPRYVGLSVVRLGDNVLPIARWREPKPFKEVPTIVKKLLPSLGAGFDDVAGTELSAAVHPAWKLKRPTADSPTEQDLTAELSATHSIDEDPYSDAAKLAWSWRKGEGKFRSVTLAARYSTERELLDDRTHDNDSGGANAGVMFKLRPNTRLFVDAGYGKEHDELSATATEAATDERVDEATMRVLYESIPRPALGFLRASLWANDSSGYGQVVARAAYAKEWRLRDDRPNHNLGIEVTLGAGDSWGDVPEHARFHGGSQEQRFLYDGATSTSMLDSPGGPMLRSFGENAARLGDASAGFGGTRFWHLNVDLAIPISRWSMPLIPNESTDVELPGSDGPLTIKQMMTNQVDKTGRNFLQTILENRGLSIEEASRQADDIMAEVQPAAHFVINDANVFSVKPMLMLDVAGLSDGNQSETWAAVGLGVQVMVVTAKFEAGYSQTISGPTFGSRGAPFARLVFQRLF